MENHNRRRNLWPQHQDKQGEVSHLRSIPSHPAAEGRYKHPLDNIRHGRRNNQHHTAQQVKLAPLSNQPPHTHSGACPLGSTPTPRLDFSCLQHNNRINECPSPPLLSRGRSEKLPKLSPKNHGKTYGMRREFESRHQQHPATDWNRNDRMPGLQEPKIQATGRDLRRESSYEINDRKGRSVHKLAPITSTTEMSMSNNIPLNANYHHPNSQHFSSSQGKPCRSMKFSDKQHSLAPIAAGNNGRGYQRRNNIW